MPDLSAWKHYGLAGLLAGAVVLAMYHLQENGFEVQGRILKMMHDERQQVDERAKEDRAAQAKSIELLWKLQTANNETTNRVLDELRSARKEVAAVKADVKTVQKAVMDQ